jgi:pimeloyl-ACP methyl ester carboxylesterase
MKMHCMKIGGLLFLATLSAFGQTITAPPQPTSGPGSNQALYGVLQSGPFVVSGQSKKGGYTYYTYTPIGLSPSQSNPNPLPTPKTAPVVMFLCAENNGASEPTDYLGLLQQLAEMGYTAVFPNYNTKESKKDYEAVILADFNDAINTLTTNETLVKPALNSGGEPLYSVVGHSEGGYLAVNFAATASANGVTPPLAVVSFEANASTFAAINAQAINPSTLVVLLVADEDDKNRICPSVALWSQMTQIADVYKPFLYARSDSTGTPAQLANHWFPLTYTKQDTDPPPNAIDDRDWNITYKMSVATIACTTTSLYCDYALGNGPLNEWGSTTQTYMGLWSSGIPVLPLVLEINPVNAFSTSNCNVN